jgi:uncharacterized protein (TIGR02300 family)
MPELGKKYTCYSCHTKFYDLGKPVPLCPKCGSDQRDAEETPVVTTSRSRRAVVEEPIDEPEFTGEGEGTAASGDEEEEDIVQVEPEEADDDEEEEEDY